MFDKFKAILESAKIEAQKPKRLEPLMIAGREIPEIEYGELLPGNAIPAAVQADPELDGGNPLRGQRIRCSVRGCRDGVQYTWGGTPQASQLDQLYQHDLQATDPLIARLEAAHQSVKAGQLVPETPRFAFCLVHFNEFMDARTAAIEADRKARTEVNLPSHELEWVGASFEVEDDESVMVTDGNGVRTRFSPWQLSEVIHRIKAVKLGKRFEFRPLGPSDVAKVKALAMKQSALTANPDLVVIHPKVVNGLLDGRK